MNLKGGKVYGADKYKSYQIHKATLISFDPVKSANAVIKLFGKNNISKIQSPPDPTLKKRGIKWVRLLKGGEAEFHFVPPYDLPDNRILRLISKKEDKINPLDTQFLEDHIGIYVPDLTPVIIAALKNNIPCVLAKRGDGMNQFYVPIPGCLDYLDIDSLKLDMDEIHKIDPTFEQLEFSQIVKIQKKFQKRYKKSIKKYKKFMKSRDNNFKKIQTQKKNLLKKMKIIKYLDPKHNQSRVVRFLGNKLIITGKDSKKGKEWRITGKYNRRTHDSTLDFSSKGGPKNITAKIKKNKMIFGDGNIWKKI